MHELNVTLSNDQVIALFAATDRGRIDAVSSYLHDHVEVRFDNYDPIHGKDAYAALYREFSSNFRGIRHEIHDIWHAAESTDVVVASMTVHYSRHSGSVVSVPCCNVLHVENGRIRKYCVYLDITPALAPDG